jgi:outer membrane protein assembly factor BamB
MNYPIGRRSIPLGVIVAIGSVFLASACSSKPSVQGEPPAKAEGDGPGRSVPMFGGDMHRNLASTVEKNIPGDFAVEEGNEKNLKWRAQLGGTSYGGPVVAGGKVFVGTNNERPRNPAIKGDKGVLMCFSESDGKFLWQIVHDKLEEEIDAGRCGVASTPVVEGDRLYYVSNQCQVVCASAEDGKIIWTLDMHRDLKVYPGGLSGGLANCSPLIAGDMVIVGTSNGVDAENGKVHSPEAPSFLAVNKMDGKVAWKSNLPGNNIMDGQWSSPAAAEVDGKVQVIFAGGDGWLYSLDSQTGELIWKFDCNPKKSVFKPGGRGDRNYIVATPVVYEKKVYVAVGHEPDSGTGVGHLWCVDITKKPANKDKDLSPVDDNFDPRAAVNKDSGLVWHYGGEVIPAPTDGSREHIFGRTVSTVAIHDGLVYAAELTGYLHCVDANTGKKYWVFDLKDSTWSSPYYVDGKVFLGTDAGEMFVFEAGKELKKPTRIDMLQSLKTPPVACNGTLYVSNGVYLYAIQAK